MATSDQLLKRREVSISYLITGEGGLIMGHDCSNYATLEDADVSAIERALNLAKSFTGISLYRVYGKQKEFVPLRRPVVKQKGLFKKTNF